MSLGSLGRFSLWFVVLAGCSRRPAPDIVPTRDTTASAVPSAKASGSTTSTRGEPTPIADLPLVPIGPSPSTVIYRVGPELWRVSSSGTDARALKIKAEDLGGTVNIGSIAPLVSPNRSWIAYIHDSDLWVARTDGTDIRRITTYTSKKKPATGAEVLISGFLPDSSALLFHVSEVHTEDGEPPLPKGTIQGFYRLALEPGVVTITPEIKGFTSFGANGKSVIDSIGAAAPASGYELREQPFGGGPSKLLRSTKDAYGFSQLQVLGDRLTFVDASAVVVGDLSTGPLTPITRKGTFAEFQRPRFSPGGRNISYEVHKATTKSIAVWNSSGLVINVCTSCDARWHDDNHLVVEDKTGLRLVRLDGTSLVLATNGQLVEVGTH